MEFVAEVSPLNNRVKRVLEELSWLKESGFTTRRPTGQEKVDVVFQHNTGYTLTQERDAFWLSLRKDSLTILHLIRNKCGQLDWLNNAILSLDAEQRLTALHAILPMLDVSKERLKNHLGVGRIDAQFLKKDARLCQCMKAVFLGIEVKDAVDNKPINDTFGYFLKMCNRDDETLMRDLRKGEMGRKSADVGYYAEHVLERLCVETSIPFDGKKFAGRNIDLAVPNTISPRLVVESILTQTTSSGQNDKAKATGLVKAPVTVLMIDGYGPIQRGKSYVEQITNSKDYVYTFADSQLARFLILLEETWIVK